MQLEIVFYLIIYFKFKKYKNRRNYIADIIKDENFKKLIDKKLMKYNFRIQEYI